MSNQRHTSLIQRRTAYLRKAARQLEKLFEEAGYSLPRYRVHCTDLGCESDGQQPSAGFIPEKPSLETGTVVGSCHRQQNPKIASVIEVSVRLNDPIEALAVLVHELCHLVTSFDDGHGPEFQSAMAKLGLTGNPTATVPTRQLRKKLARIAIGLGQYPQERDLQLLRHQVKGGSVKSWANTQHPVKLGSLTNLPATTGSLLGGGVGRQGRAVSRLEASTSYEIALTQSRAAVIAERGRSATRALESVAIDAAQSAVAVTSTAVALSQACPAAEPILRSITEQAGLALGRVVSNTGRDLT